MSRWLLIVFLAFILAHAAFAGHPIEFSAVPEEYTSEGIAYRRLVFKDENRAIHYRPPARWQCQLIDNRVRLTPPDKPFAQVRIAATPLETPTPFDDAAMASLTATTLQNVPPASQGARVVSQEMDAVRLTQHASFQVVIAYEALGETFHRAALFVNTRANRIIFEVSAPKRDFAAVYDAFRASLATWEWQAEPTAEAPAE